MVSKQFVKSLVRAIPLAVCMMAAPAFATDPGFDRAVESYHSGRLAEAYGKFLSLGFGGDPDAARIALFMGQYATLLFRTEWELTDVDVRRLREVAARRSARTFVFPETAGDSTGLRHAIAVEARLGH